MAYYVEIKGLDKLQQQFKRYPSIARARIKQGLAASIAELRKHTGRETVPWRTGALASTFGFRMGEIEAAYYPTRHYAPYVEFGTRRMTSRPYMQKIIDQSQGGINKHWQTVIDRITSDIAKQ